MRRSWSFRSAEDGEDFSGERRKVNTVDEDGCSTYAPEVLKDRSHHTLETFCDFFFLWVTFKFFFGEEQHLRLWEFSLPKAKRKSIVLRMPLTPLLTKGRAVETPDSNSVGFGGGLLAASEPREKGPGELDGWKEDVWVGGWVLPGWPLLKK